MANGKPPLQLEFGLLLTEAAMKADRQSYIRTVRWKQRHMAKELAVLDRDLEKWRAALSLGEKNRARDKDVVELKALIREGERNRKRVCELMVNLDDSIRGM